MNFIDLNAQYKALEKDIDQAIQKVLDSGKYINGDEVKKLAKELADYCGVKYCLPCANGTDALVLALKALDIKKNDAVFVPTFTFFASAETIAQVGATPIFIDIDNTFNIDTQKLEKAIKEVKKKTDLNPKAILTVDLFGQPADYIKIEKIAKKYNLKIIEDSAQGFGGEIKGRKACSFGDISTTSFFPAKPLGCYGDGGAIFTDDKELFELLSSYAVHGKGSYKYDNVRIGYNSRLDTIQAAILLVKLRAFKDFELTKRNDIAKKYTKNLKEKYTTPYVKKGFLSSWAQYTLILSDEMDREDLIKYLKEKDIPSMVYYPIPMHLQTAFGGYNFNLDDLKYSEELCKKVLSIPMSPYLTDDDQNKIIKVLLEY